jgi:hypothetical protein
VTAIPSTPNVYPAAIPSFIRITPGVDPILGADHFAIARELLSIEAVLGAYPSGVFVNIAERVRRANRMWAGVVKAMNAGTSTLTAITNCVNNGSGLIRITSAAHGLSTSDYVSILGVLGTTEANGEWIVTVISASVFDLQGSTFSNSYVSGGVVQRLSWSAGRNVSFAISGLGVAFTRPPDVLVNARYDIAGSGSPNSEPFKFYADFISTAGCTIQARAKDGGALGNTAASLASPRAVSVIAVEVGAGP